MSAGVVVQHLSAEAVAEIVAEGQAEPHELDPELAHWLTARSEKGAQAKVPTKPTCKGGKRARMEGAAGQGAGIG